MEGERKMSIHWPLVFFLLLVGWGCGVYAVSVVTTDWFGKSGQIRMNSMIISFVLLVVGGISSVFHLGRPSRIIYALSRPTSGIFIEALLIGLLGLMIIIYMIAVKRNAADKTLKIIGSIGIIPAVILAYALGNTYVLAARPAWDTILLPLNYFASAAVMGSATVAVLAARAKEPDKQAVQGLNRATLISLIVQALLIIGYLIYLSAAPFPDESRSAGRVLAGDLAPLFWVGIVILGLLIPAVLVFQMRKKEVDIRNLLMRIQVSLVCIVAGSAALRVMVFLLGSAVKDYFNVPV